MIGAGMVSQYHVQGWLDCPEAQLVAIADPDIEKARDRATKVAGASAHTSLEEMVAKCNLDAVDIVAPPAAHAALISRAQAAGLHAICQKPLAPNADIAKQIMENKNSSLRSMVHENWRWRHPYRALKAALDRKKVSVPNSFEFRVESSGLVRNENGIYPALERQPFFTSMQRLLVFELLIHHLDTLSFLFGDIKIRSAQLHHQSGVVPGEDGAEILLSAGGIEGKLIGSFCAPDAPPMPRDRLFLNNSDTPIIDGWSMKLPNEQKRSWDEHVAYQDSYSDTIRHFRHCIGTGERFETEIQDAVVLQSAIEQIYEYA
ncbi:Gfo/Idh/MocA family oxidoreductase [Halocynthiibacter sp. C4]|uniref:Gfo/Idh/MocA family protein n=1 Tax=Halocynthiibacter sp. C4 TaxID=2992758 RepID=UPI00237A1EBE|nr:Gfo/Idh/MocA family oxidoreductase [Halocynthiibacter sp. C4]MDE0590027.1 Gfo/Idh/MocA family oxidoreductase [Halocynthiibacter sp. C4]